MNKQILNTFGFNLTYTKMLVDDIPADRMCELPGGLDKHPAWVLGHLAEACESFCAMLGQEYQAPADWKELFASGSKPTTDAAKYPDKAAFVTALEKGHERLAKAFADAPASVLDQPLGMEEIRPMFPTVGDFVVFALTSHEGIHLGQLSAWRRAQGLPAVF